jgi:putative transposase
MGSIGDCFDKAVIESFSGRMPDRAVQPSQVEDPHRIRDGIFEYLEMCHNRQRRHSALAMLTPIVQEKLHPTVPPVT